MNDTIRKLICQIAKERNRRNLSQQEAASRAGVTQSYWSRVESGYRPVASLEALDKLARAVGLKIDIRLTKR